MRSTLEWLMSRSCQSATFSRRRDGVAAQHSREAAEPFARDRVALVRHCRTAFLARAEKLLHFQNLRALEMAKLGRPTVDARRDERQRGRKFRVPVALDDLRAQDRRFQAEAFAHRLFDARIEVCVRADRAAEFADAHALTSLREPFLGAAELVVHQRQFQPERQRFRVDTVATPDHRRIFERHRPRGNGGSQASEVFEQEVAGRRHLHGQCRVEDVRGGQPLVHPTRGGSDVGRDVFQERDDIVLCPLLDDGDFIDVESRAFARMVSASARGIWPISASASQARTSISSQMANLRSSDQSARMAGRE